MRHLSATLLAAQRAAARTPYVSLTPGLGATMLFRHYNASNALTYIGGMGSDPSDPEHIYVGGYSANEGEGSNDFWLGKVNVVDLSKDAAVLYGDGNSQLINSVCVDETHVFVAGVDTSKAAVSKYNKELARAASVKFNTATQADKITQSGDYVYVAAITTEGAQALSYTAIIAELNKSDLSKNAAYYADEAAAGEPLCGYQGITCDGTNVFACGWEQTSGDTRGIVDKFDVAGLANGSAKIINYGTDVYLKDITHDETHIYAVGYDDSTPDVCVAFKLLKSDLSLVAAATYTYTEHTRLYHVEEDGDYLYAFGHVYYGGAIAKNCGLILKIRKSDLTIETQQAFQKTTSPANLTFYGMCQDANHVYAGGGIGYTTTKFNKSLQTTGAAESYTVAISTLAYADISGSTTVGASGRQLTSSGDDVGSTSLTAAASAVTLGDLQTIGATALSGYTSSDRILAVIQTEAQYQDSCELIMDNADQQFKSEDWRGVQLSLAFGFTVAGTNYYSYVPVLYVVQQEDISVAGKLFTRLSCIGNWGKLAMLRVMGDAVAADLSTGTDTVKEIINKRKLPGMEIIVDTSDGTQDTKVPAALYPVFTDRRQVIQECNGLTDNLLKMRGPDMHMIKKNDSQQHRITGTVTGTFVEGETVTQAVTAATGKFVYQTSTYIVVEAETGTFTESANAITADSGGQVANPSAIDAFDYLYGPLAGDHTFFEYVRSQKLLDANRIICVDTLPNVDGTTHSYSGTANDTTDQAAFGLSTLIFEDPSVASDAAALASAEARLLHIQQNAQGGTLVAPMDCGQEMYDYVQVDDDRGGWTSDLEVPGRVTHIVRRYNASSQFGPGGMYSIELGFGGLEWDWPDDFDMSILAPPVPQEVLDLMKMVMEPPVTTPHDLPPSTLPPVTDAIGNWPDIDPRPSGNVTQGYGDPSGRIVTLDLNGGEGDDWREDPVRSFAAKYNPMAWLAKGIGSLFSRDTKPAKLGQRSKELIKQYGGKENLYKAVDRMRERDEEELRKTYGKWYK